MLVHSDFLSAVHPEVHAFGTFSGFAEETMCFYAGRFFAVCSGVSVCVIPANLDLRVTRHREAEKLGAGPEVRSGRELCWCSLV